MYGCIYVQMSQVVRRTEYTPPFHDPHTCPYKLHRLHMLYLLSSPGLSSVQTPLGSLLEQHVLSVCRG